MASRHETHLAGEVDLKGFDANVLGSGRHLGGNAQLNGCREIVRIVKRGGVRWL
jgi:hypothetical protein